MKNKRREMSLESQNIITVDKQEESHYSTDSSIRQWIENWDFTKSNPKTYTHRIHNYPAIFIPQLVRKLIEEYSSENDLILDIFNGSGTTSVECTLTNRDSIGIELNPLAFLLAKTKTQIIPPTLLEQAFKDVEKKYFNSKYKFIIPSFKNIDFWYSKEAIENIAKLLAAIKDIKDNDVQDFMLVSISKILREVSVCKHSGFKMHKDTKKESLIVSTDYLWEKFQTAYRTNYEAYKPYYDFFSDKSQPRTKLILGSSTEKQKEIKPNSVDLIVTSPPYGDSKTTVAYGQFSRLSSQWLDLGGNRYDQNSVANLDSDLLGGKTNGVDIDNDIVQKSITLLSVRDLFKYKIGKENNQNAKKLEKRLKDVLSFYIDLDKAIELGSYYLKEDKYFILVTASRIVKEVKLHTDIIISEFAENYNLELKSIMYRNIPNKRMPRQVSATNVIGEKANTMTRESIIVLKKLKK